MFDTIALCRNFDGGWRTKGWRINGREMQAHSTLSDVHSGVLNKS